MSFRKIKVKSGNEESTLEVTEEEYSVERRITAKQNIKINLIH